jgi:flagellar biosynthesis protein FlhA
MTVAPRLDLVVGVAVVGIIGVMLIPIPPVLLDVLIAMNITVAVLLLLVSLYILEPIGFSVFPTLLLILTLFRLSLNVSSTRLILLDGNQGASAAGKVIESFGQFVVGGNYVVGAVIFLVLIAIQYIVVNHGAVRISEVTARFTLDAMPGKQMSIDADLSAGLIDEDEARERRKQVNREAEFYGAMDGAVRFTQRDAVASIIIVLINIVAGLLIGVLGHGMPFLDAVATFSVLTIGDGLVSAIPALLIAVTAGIMTTRAASESDLGTEVSRQMLADPKPVGIASVMLLILALVPGLPFLVFLFLSIGTGLVALFAHRKRRISEAEVAEEKSAATESSRSEEKIESLMKVDPLGLELGYQLIHLVDNKPGADLLSRVKAIRRQIAVELGVIVPPVHITDNLQLKPKEYRILLKGVGVATASLMPGYVMAINPGGVTGELEGIEAKEPTFDLPALWIRPEEREKAQMAGYTVVDNTTVLATHLTEVIKVHLHELISRQEVKQLIDSVNESHPKVVEELIPKFLSVGEVQKVLQNLLRERVSIRDMVTVLECLADFAPRTRNISLLTEYVRQALGRSICQPYVNDKGEMQIFTMSPEIERQFEDAVTVTEQDNFLAIDPNLARDILQKIHGRITAENAEGYPILLTSSTIRAHVKRFVEQVISNLVVLSHNEIQPTTRLIKLGEIA